MVAREERDAKGEARPRPELGPLLGGHHGLSPEQVAESQRERLIAAVVQITAERGYRAATITGIVKAASVSTRIFYRHFDSVETCFLAAFEAVLAHLEALLAAEIEPILDWPHRVIAALRAALDFFAAEPQLARLCLVEAVTATPATALRFERAVGQCVPLLALGRSEQTAPEALPRSTEDSLLGGVVSSVSRSLLAMEPLPLLLPDLVEFLLSPYLGAASAREFAAQA